MSTPKTNPADGDTRLLSSDALRGQATAAIERALAEGEPLSLVACIPQQLPGERASGVVGVAAACIDTLLRGDDFVGLIESDVLAIALPDTDAAGARVLAFRIKGELRLRTAHLRSTVWEAGCASLPDDGSTVDDLIAAALQSAKMSRRNAA